MKEHVHVAPGDPLRFFDSEIWMSNFNLNGPSKGPGTISDEAARQHGDQKHDTSKGPGQGLPHEEGDAVCRHRVHLGINISLIPGIGWGNLGLALLFGLFHDSM